MIRNYDLSIDCDVLEGWLNDPQYRIESCRIGCSDTGYTTATIETKKSRTPIKRKRHRRIDRFVLFDGSNTDLDDILDDERYRIIRKYQFITEQGVIFVLDYEYFTEEL